MKDVLRIGITDTEQLANYISWLSAFNYPIEFVLLSHHLVGQKSFDETLNENLKKLATIDAIVFVGGDDFSLERLNIQANKETYAQYHLIVDKTRDNMEWSLAKKSLELNIPLLGICRGMQLINLVLGGDIYLDIQEECPDANIHTLHPRRKNFYHAVSIEKKSLTHLLIGSSRIEQINSLHHQAIKTPSKYLNVVGTSDDGIIEAMESKDSQHPLVLVQWHPEKMWNEDHTKKNEISNSLGSNFLAMIEQKKK